MGCLRVCEKPQPPPRIFRWAIVQYNAISFHIFLVSLFGNLPREQIVGIAKCDNPWAGSFHVSTKVAPDLQMSDQVSAIVGTRILGLVKICELEKPDLIGHEVSVGGFS
jgi:hypothetical protein